MKKKIALFISLGLITLLTACNSGVPFEYEEYSHDSAFINTHSEINAAGYYRHKKQGSIDLNKTFNGVQVVNNLYDLKAASEKKAIMPSYSLNSGDEYEPKDLNLLVVPLAYRDSPSYHNDKLKEELTIKIQNAFFGTKKHNNYYSVSEYYEKASYGHIHLRGEVTQFYEYDVPSTSIENRIDEAKKIVVDIANYLNTEHSVDLTKYDQNSDNHIDGIYVVYDHPSAISDQGDKLLFWQVTSQVEDNELGNIIGGHQNRNDEYSPNIRDFSWSSTDCLGTKGIVSSNYYLHECGHLFGLEDYYNTGKGYYQPTGFFDMMDYNIGDHSAFSKYLLNWTSPYVVTDSCTIKLKPFNSSGQFILIPADLERFESHQTPYDEYLLLEFFAPTGLNDSSDFPSYRYYDKDGNSKIYNYPSVYGLKVYHVDARLAYYSGSSVSKTSRVDYIYKYNDIADKSSLKNINYAYHNKTDEDENDAPVLYHLLERSGNNSFVNGNGASNKTLFQLHDNFGVNVFKDFSFHGDDETNNHPLEYTFEISRFSLKEITINFKKK